MYQPMALQPFSVPGIQICEGAALAGLAALLAHVEGDGHRAAGGGGVQVVIDGDEEVAGAHVGGAGAGGDFVPRAAEVRLAGRIGHLLGQGLVFARPAHRQVPPFRLEGRGLVAVAGDAEFLIHPLRQPAGQRRAFFQRNPGHRDERQHVGGAAARVRAVMLAHVDQFLGFRRAPESGFDDRLRLAHEGDDRPVRRLAGIHVQHLHAFHRGNRRHDGVDDRLVPPFAIVLGTHSMILFIEKGYQFISQR